VKRVRYSEAAYRELLRHANMASRIRKAMLEYASETGARRNQVVALKGSSAKRLRVGDFRIVFEEDVDTIFVTKIGPRGDVYE
jgi:mRNA interferase RelE/StbE